MLMILKCIKKSELAILTLRSAAHRNPELSRHWQKMSNLSFLEFQYHISKCKFLRKPTRSFSLKDRQDSGLPVYQPNKDEIKRVFDKFDSNRDGKISPGEYKAILKAMGKETTIKEVAKIFEVADLDGDGFIDFKDFLEVLKRGGWVKIVDIQNAFQVFDSDGDGKISAEDVFELQGQLGEKCSLQDCRKMVKAVDTNGDGVIDFDEFMAMMTSTMKLC